jgi:hypothetical protein
MTARACFAIPVAALVALSGRALAQPYNFIGTDPQGSDWFTAANWNPNGVPGHNPPGVEVVIGQGLHAYLGLNGLPPTVARITAAGKLTINQGIIIAGDALLTDGDIRGSGTGSNAVVCDPLTLVGQNSVWRSGRIVGRIEQGGSLVIGGSGGSSGSPSLYGTFNNTASVVQTSRLYLYNQSVVNNTGSWALHSHLSDGINQNGSGGTFKNLGLLTHLDSSTSDVTCNFESDALVRIGQGGRIWLTGANTRLNCPVELLGNASLLINQNSAPTSSVSVSGNFSGDGNIYLENIALLSVPNGITTHLNTSSAFGLRIAMGSGQVQLGAALNNDGRFTWSTGRISGPGVIHNRSGGQMTMGLSGANNAILATGLFNDARIDLRGSPQLDGGTIWNNTAGVIDFERAHMSVAPGGSGEIRNSGLILKTAAGFGNSLVSVPVNMLDGGYMEIEDYGIWLYSPSTWTGATSVYVGPATSARLRFEAGTHTVNSGTSRYYGTGSAEIGSAATLQVRFGANIRNDIAAPSRFDVQGQVYLQEGSQFMNLGHLRVSGHMFADFFEEIALTNMNLMTLQGGTLEGTMRNLGLLKIMGTCELGDIHFGHISNRLSGVIELNGSCSLNLAYESVIVSDGLLRKIGVGSQGLLSGAGTLYVSSSAAVEAIEGTLNIACSLSNLQNGVLTGGTWYAAPDAQLLLPGPVTKLGPGTSVTGSSQSCPWLRNITENQGSMRFIGDQTHLVPIQNTGGGMVQIDPGVDVTIPGGVNNGHEESILDEITEVINISRGAQPRLITPVLNNYARLIPGGHDEPGPFNLVGNLIMRSTARILVELGGPQPLLEHDRVAITGSASLDGTLQLDLIDEFIPTPGEQFTILTATGGISGTFASVVPPAGAPAGLSFDVVYTPFSVIVQIGSATCYANCDGSTVQPVLNVEDFTCFINEFAQAQILTHAQQISSYANCDGSTIAPVLNVDDFTCFINAFAQGCP